MATSSYSTALGIPVAAWGTACSLVLAAGALRWWRAADRRALLAAYLLLLAATLVVAVLTYLEIFEIRAICGWCATYAASIVASLGVAGLALRQA